MEWNRKWFIVSSQAARVNKEPPNPFSENQKQDKPANLLISYRKTG
jgi:hypothetical protein